MNTMIISVLRDPIGAYPILRPNEIILVNADDIASEPARSLGNIIASGNLTLKEGSLAIRIFVLTDSIDCGYTSVEESRTFKHSVAFDSPGLPNEMEDFIEVFSNLGVVAIVPACDTGKTKLYGRKCNPLRLSIEVTDNKEANKARITLSQELPTRFLPSFYSGEIPEAAYLSNLWMDAKVWQDDMMITMIT